MLKIARRTILYPLQLLVGCHTLLTGSPIPLWHIEELKSPQTVTSITESGLVLEDGKTVKLPYIESIPKYHQIFREAISQGVEVRPDGEVIGLLQLQRFCGNDPVVHRVIRVNLTDLSGALKPVGIAPDIIPADEQISFAEIIGDIPDDERIDLFLLIKTRQVRKQIAFVTGNERYDTDATHGRVGQHDLRSGGLLMNLYLETNSLYRFQPKESPHESSTTRH